MTTEQAEISTTTKVRPLFIGVTGGTASGKTSLCRRLGEQLKTNVALVSLDHFYKGLSDEDHDNAHLYNFDHPDALDFELAYEKITELLDDRDCEIPTYDFATHKRTNVMMKIATAPIVIFEGIHALYEQRFRDLMDLKIFVLTPDDIRLARRITRDIEDRGREVVDVLSQYCKQVKPAYDDFIKPTMKFSDVIVPFILHNDKAVNMLV